MSQTEPSNVKSSKKKVIILMALGLLIPIFLVSMAILAVNSDAKNQEKYAQQKADMLKRIEAREAAEKLKAEQANAASETAVASEPQVEKVQPVNAPKTQ
ncbi:MAG: hypothetical protein ACN6NX_09410 [Acinetobacter sp.]